MLIILSSQEIIMVTKYHEYIEGVILNNVFGLYKHYIPALCHVCIKIYVLSSDPDHTYTTAHNREYNTLCQQSGLTRPVEAISNSLWQPVVQVGG